MISRLLSERAVVALVLLLVGSGLTISTFGLQFAELGGAFSPTFFPRIILMIWVGLAAANLLVDLGTKKEGAEGRFLPVVLIGAAFVLYVLAMPHLGFFACSVILSAFILVALGLREPLAIASISIGAPAVLLVLFNHVLTMPLPTSPFFWWI